jgi:hypothetical protein
MRNESKFKLLTGKDYHAWCKTRTYHSWQAMKTRCYNPRRQDWRLYGARGIEVCDRWRKSFPNFLADMGERPEGTTLDRIDSNGNYTPENCRWSTPKEQAMNSTKPTIITFNGTTDSVSGWAKRLGVRVGALKSRIRRGWTVEDMLSRPVSKAGPKFKHAAKTRLINFNGEMMPVQRACKASGVAYSTAKQRLSKGLSVEDALRPIVNPDPAQSSDTE